MKLSISEIQLSKKKNPTMPQKLALGWQKQSLLYLLGRSEDNHLDGASGVSFRRHGPPQALHGGVVGAPDQRFAVHRYHLIVYTQTAILLGEDDR